MNDGSSTQICYPKAGECYLINVGSVKHWKGMFHCDGLSWRSKGTSNSSDVDYISEDFIFMKKSKPFPSFKKTTHYNPNTKIMLIQYHGNEGASVEREKHGNRKHGNVLHVPTSTYVKVKYYSNYLFSFQYHF